MPAKKTVIDCTRGLSREERTIARRNRLESLISSGRDGKRKRWADWLDKRIEKSIKLRKEFLAIRAIEDAKFEQIFKLEHPDQVPSSISFQEKEFGPPGSPDEVLQALGVNKDITPHVSNIVVSLALFEGDKMLFACSGVAVPSGMACKLDLTRFVTSRRLVDEFNKHRNLDDKLRIDVGLPNNRHRDGFLGLYDEHIAIVTSCNCEDHVCPVDLDPGPSVRHVIAAARASESGRLMVTPGYLTSVSHAIWEQITEAALGGPLFDINGMFLGVNLHIDIDNVGSLLFISASALRERLEHFQILK